MYQIYATPGGLLIHHDAHTRLAAHLTWDTLFTAENAKEVAQLAWLEGTTAALPSPGQAVPAPVGSQEVWAAGVTYYRSRTARMEESEDTGGARFYDRVYDAERPELFYKGNALRARGHHAELRFRKDSAWSVPEPELTLAISASGKVFGYTIGNDASSRDIEGENLLYLPQAKVYKGSLGLGPCLTVCDPLPATTPIRIRIERRGQTEFEGETTLAQLKRPPQDLADWLFKENEFPYGAYLLTGTGIVPPGQWTLAAGDLVSIEIPPLGVLQNIFA